MKLETEIVEKMDHKKLPMLSELAKMKDGVSRMKVKIKLIVVLLLIGSNAYAAQSGGERSYIFESGGRTWGYIQSTPGQNTSGGMGLPHLDGYSPYGQMYSKRRPAEDGWVPLWMRDENEFHEWKNQGDAK